MDNKDNNNLLLLSWHDSAWIPTLCPANIMDYFSERTNPFYDRTCNNEVVKMQRLNPEHLNNLTGLEYILLHCQEPILYVVRKQHRHSASQVTPLADYYIIAGVVYQAPDLGSIINSRVLSTIHHVQYAFEKTQSYSRYHPSKGYWWDFKEQETTEDTKTKEKGADEPSSLFQRQRVDVLLGELAKKYPPKIQAPPVAIADKPPPPPVQVEEPPATAQQPAPGPVAPQTSNPQSQPLPKPVSEIKQEKPDAVISTTTISGTSSSTAVTTTTTSAANNQTTNSKSSTKPPLEKRPRLMA